MNRRSLQKEVKKMLFQQNYPQLVEEVVSLSDDLEFNLQKGLEEIKRENEKMIRESALREFRTITQGNPGEAGYTPVKGEDYFDGKDGYTPVKGVDYFDGKDGYTPIKGRDYFDGKDGKTPRFGIDFNFPEQPKIFDTPEQIIEKLSIPQGDNRLDASAIKNIPTVQEVIKQIKALKGNDRLSTSNIQNMPENQPLDQRWHGGGDLVEAGTNITITTSSSGKKVISASASASQVDNEIVAGTGTAWTLASTPALSSQHIYGNGQRLTPGIGNDYTISGANITTALSWVAGSLLADYRT